MKAVGLILVVLTVGCSAFMSPSRNLPCSMKMVSTGPLMMMSSAFRMASSDAGGGPAVLEPPTKEADVADKVEQDDKTEQKQRLGSDGWEVRLWNDPFNKREFVARCLATVCGKSDTESFQIMMHAHQHGMGVIGRYQFEIAELYHNSLREQGLMIDMVPVDDE